MKLNEYIYHKSQYYGISNPEEVEKWIVEWYMNTFKKGGCDGELEGETARLPPMWLANWRPHIRNVEEQERCGIDEG